MRLEFVGKVVKLLQESLNELNIVYSISIKVKPVNKYSGPSIN